MIPIAMGNICQDRTTGNREKAPVAAAGAARGRSEVMNFDYTEKVEQLRAKLMAFMDEHIYPNERVYEDQLNALV